MAWCDYDKMSFDEDDNQHKPKKPVVPAEFKKDSDKKRKQKKSKPSQKKEWINHDH